MSRRDRSGDEPLEVVCLDCGRPGCQCYKISEEDKAAARAKHSRDGMSITGNGITLYMWLSIRSGLSLESKGIKLRAGPSLRSTIAKRLGMKPRSSMSAVREAVEKKIEETAKLLKPGEIERF